MKNVGVSRVLCINGEVGEKFLYFMFFKVYYRGGCPRTPFALLF